MLYDKTGEADGSQTRIISLDRGVPYRSATASKLAGPRRLERRFQPSEGCALSVGRGAEKWYARRDLNPESPGS